MARKGAQAGAQGARDFAAAFSVSRETLDRLELYAALLSRWQKTHNLVADATLGQLWSRHFADSAQLLAHGGGALRWADLGSGGGFPGMVLAILLAETPGAEVHLVESNAKKCAFLNTVRRETGAPARVHAGRIEDVVPDLANRTLANQIEAVSARALAPLARLLGLCAPLLSCGARGLFLKGQDIDAELTDASRYWIIHSMIKPSLTDPAGRILIVHSCQRRADE